MHVNLIITRSVFFVSFLKLKKRDVSHPYTTNMMFKKKIYGNTANTSKIIK